MKQLVCASLVALLLSACDKPQPPVRMHDAAKPPARLSDWNLLAVDGARLRMNEGVIPYDLNTPLFSDYALKLRSVWMPDGTAASLREDGGVEFPVGTILTKTFHYRYSGSGFQKVDAEATLEADGALNLDAHRLVETRLLVKYRDGWKAFPYVWNEDQADATLAIAGAQFDFKLAGKPFAYIVPDMNQCASCHTPDHGSKALQPIGPKPGQLNRDFTYADGSRNQLDYWRETGRLDRLPTDTTRNARWSERAMESLDDAARAYLDVNCAHCHNPEGAADTSALNLDLESTVDRRYGVCKPPVAVGRGSGNRPYDIFPGKPDESILLFRMEHDDPAIMMPELGRAMAHVEGVALIREWITSLPGDC
jgi:uncharacterized repeat protein (TIGR03806 family)